jgi:hypothetical protein
VTGFPLPGGDTGEAQAGEVSLARGPGSGGYLLQRGLRAEPLACLPLEPGIQPRTRMVVSANRRPLR